MSEDFINPFPGPFRRGDRLTAEQMNAIIAAIVSSFRSKDALMSNVGGKLVFDLLRPDRHRDTFLAKITGHSNITAGAQWKYAWTEIRLDVDDLGTKIDARSGTTGDGYALNLVELNNTTATADAGDGIVADKDSSDVDYPDGYARRPIGAAGDTDDHAIDVAVNMTVVVDEDGDKRFVFSQVNGHHGTCAE